MPVSFFRAVAASSLFLFAFTLMACGAAVESPAAPVPASSGASAGEPAAAAPAADAETHGAEPSVGADQAQVQSIKAGEIDDNQRWDEYLRYRSEYFGPAVHDVDVSERYVISVRDVAGRSVPDALVRVSSDDGNPIFEARTYTDGRTLFFPRAFPGVANVGAFRLYAEKEGVSKSHDMERGQGTEWTVNLDAEPSYGDAVPLDVLFLLDATGSMADEINQIKRTLVSISERINALPANPDLRFGMVTYRDREDEFVTRVYHFEPDVQKFTDAIKSVAAEGGGDDPESLNEALHMAIHAPEWRRDDAVRLVFLVADAPPHLDYSQDYDYAKEMAIALERGIKIFAVASSDLSRQGEYIFRQIAQHTMGRFIFLLYPDGRGGLTTPHEVGQYTVEQLDDLVVRLVEEELAHLSQ